MTERSRFWNGTTVGDAAEAPYDAPTEFARVFDTLFSQGTEPSTFPPTAWKSVLPYQGTMLAVSGIATPVSVADGRALVYGTWYENDAAVTVAIPTPAGATRVDCIVLRKDWAAQTVRITRVAGTEGAGVPVIDDNPGVTWDAKLADVSITTGGVITVTDKRQYVMIGRRPFCSAYRTSYQSLAVSPTVTTVSWEAAVESVDSDMWDIAAPTRVYARRAGFYRFLVVTKWAGYAGINEIYLRKNGGTESSIASLATTNPAGMLIGSGQISLASGDYLEVRIQWSGGAGPINLDFTTVDPRYPRFELEFIQPAI